VAFDFAAGVQKQDGQTFAFRVEMGMGGNVQFPVVGGFVGVVAKLQGVGRGTLAQGRYPVFIGAGGKLERLDKRFHAGEKWCGVHGDFRR